MLLDLETARAKPSGVPEEWRPYLGRTENGFCITGDKTAARQILLYVGDGGVVVADRGDELLDHLANQAVVPTVSGHGISALLQRALIPLPGTEFDDVALVTMGDRIELNWDAAGVQTTSHAEYPWFAANSRNDGIPDTARLLSLITEAAARDLDAAGGNGLLMLSSGMDSVSLALAIAEAGYSRVPCVTYSSGPTDPEPPVAAAVCARLGLEHHIIELPSDTEWIQDTMIDFFTNSSGAGTDLAQIPFVLATSAVGSPGGVVIAGDGNDAYMGSLVKRRRRLKAALRIRGRRIANAAHRFIPVDSPLNYIARSRLEAGLPGRMMRFHESRALFPDAIDSSAYWWQLSTDLRTKNLFDAYSVLDKHFTVPSSMKKHSLAAMAMGSEPSLPWCDHEVADYYFNLPVEHRYDEHSGNHKSLLRRMLAQYLDYDAETVGSHYFAFDGPRFVSENEDFVRSEIRECTQWSEAGIRMVQAWIDDLGDRPFLYHPILSVFMVSGWLNHSRFLVPPSSLAGAA